MSQVDLDRVERYARHLPDDVAQLLLAMTAELRPAREVVNAARRHWHTKADGCGVCRAMAAYVARTASTDSEHAS